MATMKQASIKRRRRLAFVWLVASLICFFPILRSEPAIRSVMAGAFVFALVLAAIAMVAGVLMGFVAALVARVRLQRGVPADNARPLDISY